MIPCMRPMSFDMISTYLLIVTLNPIFTFTFMFMFTIIFISMWKLDTHAINLFVCSSLSKVFLIGIAVGKAVLSKMLWERCGRNKCSLSQNDMLYFQIC